MSTARDIITLALYDAGIVAQGQQPNADDTNRAFTRLNFMIGEWQVQRWLIWHTVDLAKTSTGALSYTIGPAGDFAFGVRPDRLEKAYFRQLVQSQPNQIDYPVDLLSSREDYTQIALKQLQSFPQVCFYDSAFPLGSVFFWPVAQATIYELHVVAKDVLAQFATLDTVINLPLEYFNALHLNLQVRLRAAYDLPPQLMVVGLAKKALAVVRGANAQIPRLTMPTDLVRPGIYNPYSDQIR